MCSARARAICKIGKKLCYPDVPSNWIPRTAHFIARRQNKLPKHQILFPPPPRTRPDYYGKVVYKYGYSSMDIHWDCSFPNHFDAFSWSYFNHLQLMDSFSLPYDFSHFRHLLFKQGSTFDLISLLSKTGCYLVRNNGDKVEVEASLRGKNILLCCFHVPVFWLDPVSNDIRSTLTSFCRHRNFEMIIVANMRHNWTDDEDAFNHFFSGFPSSCLAIPFSQTELRNDLCSTLSLTLSDRPIALRLDNNQKVVYHKCFHGLDHFAAFLELPSQLDLILDSEFVFKIGTSATDDKDKLSISEFKEKVVGLYLCYDGSFIRTLDLISRECKARNQEFHVVMVYLPYEQSVNPCFFVEVINHVLRDFNISTNSNWWVSPFDDYVSRRLWATFDFFEEDKLIILDQHKNYADPHGIYVFDWYGIDAYPFTREIMLNKAMEALRAANLESWLLHGSRDYVLRMNFNNDICNANKVPIAELHGKMILFYVHQFSRCFKDYNALLDWYYWNKTSFSDFEVVSFQMNEQLHRSLQVPWLVCPHNSQYASFVRENILRNSSHMLIAFGKDGHVITLDALDLLDSYGPKGFPSFEWYAGLRDEAISDLDVYHDINMTDLWY